jgi:ribonuclease HI
MTNTTNNRMEMKAVIETLKYFKDCSELLIISDSQYVVQNIISGSAEK